MKVISVGLPRTGTRTTYEAFRRLGLRAEHQAGGRLEFGGREIDDCLQPEDLRAFDDLDAITESKMWRLLLEAYPRAKVILTVREPGAWFESISRHADHIAARLSDDRSVSRIVDTMLAHANLLGWPTPHKTHWVERFHMHSLAVHAWCNEHKRELLTFDPTTQGWIKLCEFLEVPIPDVPWPHENRGGAPINDRMASRWWQ